MGEQQDREDGRAYTLIMNTLEQSSEEEKRDRHSHLQDTHSMEESLNKHLTMLPVFRQPTTPPPR